MEHMIIISEEDFFIKAFAVIGKEFEDQLGKDEHRALTMFKTLSTAMENLTMVWKDVATKRETDDLYEFTLEDFKTSNRKLLEKITAIAMTKGDDREFRMLYALLALTASGIIKRIGNAIAGENDDDAGD